MSEKQVDKKVISESSETQSGEMEIDLMEVFHKIFAIRKILYKAAGVGLIIGIIIALSIPRQYTVNVTLSPEMGSSKEGNGLAGLAASFLGANATGESADALNISLSTDIVSSTPFLLELFNMKVPYSEVDTLTLESYLDKQSSPWWNYIIEFPGMTLGAIKLWFVDNKDESNNNNGRESIIELTSEENRKINFLKKNIFAIVDKKTAITNISVTLQDPKVAAVVADSVVCKLQEYIINYRTSKAKDDCTYLEKLFNERRQEYYIAQKKYADYVDTHDNLILQVVRAEQERLQNDMGLAYQVYSQVANQLQVARAKVQEVKPVLAIVEPAVVPLKPSGWGLKVYALLFPLIAVFGTLVWLLVIKDIWKKFKKVN